MTKRYSLSFTENQLDMLRSSMEAEITTYYTEDELKAHDKLYARIIKALHRIDA